MDVQREMGCSDWQSLGPLRMDGCLRHAAEVKQLGKLIEQKKKKKPKHRKVVDPSLLYCFINK